jgi:hypothetical protein
VARVWTPNSHLGQPPLLLVEEHGQGQVFARGLQEASCWRRNAALQAAWRRQALRSGGMLQVGPRRDAAVRGAWRGQALPARGLRQVGSRREPVLRGAWR